MKISVDVLIVTVCSYKIFYINKMYDRVTINKSTRSGKKKMAVFTDSSSGRKKLHTLEQMVCLIILYTKTVIE